MADVEIRKCQRESFMECMMNYPLFTTLPKSQQNAVVRKLERGCYNANIEKSHKNHIPNYWDNPTFVEQYETICYNAKVNLDPESSINKPQYIYEEPLITDDIKIVTKTLVKNNAQNYLISRVYNSITADFVRVIWKKTKRNPKVLEQILKHWPRVRPEMVGKMNSLEMNPLISQKFIEDIIVRSKQQINTKYTTMYRCPKYGHQQATIRAQQTRSGDEGITNFLRCLICGDRWTIS